MMIPDANLLLYAYDQNSPFHTRAVEWWSECLSGRQPVGLCGVVLQAFIRIGTSRKAFVHPMSIDEAAGHVRSWLERTITCYLAAQEADLLRALDLLEQVGTGGNLTTDAQIAAVASRYRAVVHTADNDFKRFPGIRCRNPLQ